CDMINKFKRFKIKGILGRLQSAAICRRPLVAGECLMMPQQPPWGKRCSRLERNPERSPCALNACPSTVQLFHFPNLNLIGQVASLVVPRIWSGSGSVPILETEVFAVALCCHLSKADCGGRMSHDVATTFKFKIEKLRNTNIYQE
ncbi:hypothetical protein L9F63_025927, partial [Diploptera punctata]